MPPKTNNEQTKSPLEQYPYLPGDILLISNYKPPKKDYFPHASGKELTKSLLASMQEQANAQNTNTQTNVTVFAPMPGRLYYLNRTLTSEKNPTVILSPSLSKLPSQGSANSSDIQLVNLDNECDIDAYNHIREWILAENRHILSAADIFLKSNPDWDIYIRIPYIEKKLNDSKDKKIQLEEIDFFAQNHPLMNKNDGSRSTLTINFLHQWPDLYSPQEKIKELANFVAHFNKGQKFFNENQGQHNIDALTAKAQDIAAHQIDLQKLAAFQEQDLRVLSDILKINYEDLKIALTEAESNSIDDSKAKNVFATTCLIAFKNFSGSKNGQEALKPIFKNTPHTPLVNEAFWGNILFMTAELPLLILASGNPNNKTKIGYNQDPNNENLKLISAVSIALDRGPVNFYLPVAQSQLPIKINEFLKDFTAEKIKILDKIFCSQGHYSEGYYNVHLTVNALDNIIRLYMSFLYQIIYQDINKETQKIYESFDQKFWSNIHAITSTIIRHLAYEEMHETSEKEYLSLLCKSSRSYLHATQTIEDKKNSGKPIYSDKNALNSRLIELEKVTYFKSDKSHSSAAKPEVQQLEIFNESIHKAFLIFVAFSKTKAYNEEIDKTGSREFYLFEAIHRLTNSFKYYIVPYYTTYNPNRRKPYFEKKSQHVSFRLPAPTNDELSPRVIHKLQNSSSNSNTDVLADAVISHTNAVVNQICTPAGCYNVLLAMDFLNVVLNWYVYTLNTIAIRNVEHERYKEYDQKFWLNIKSIAKRMHTQFLANEPKMTNDIEYLSNLSKTADKYLSSDTNTNDYFSVNQTFTSRKTLSAWRREVTAVKDFISANPSTTTATPPETAQLTAYKDAFKKADLAFASLGVASNSEMEKLDALESTTSKFDINLVGQKTTASRLSSNGKAEYVIRQPNFKK